MYCPNCSTEASTDQKFCRTCGMELHAVAALVSGQSSTAPPQSPAHGGFPARCRAMIIWGFFLTFGSVGVAAGLKILGKENIHPAGEFTPYVSVIFVLLAFVGMGLMSYSVLQMSSGRKRSASSKAEPTLKLQTALLPEQPASVVEQTTEMLEEPASSLCAQHHAAERRPRIAGTLILPGR